MPSGSVSLREDIVSEAQLPGIRPSRRFDERATSRFPAQRALKRAGCLDERGGRGPKGDLKVRRGKTARALTEEFIEVYGGCFPKAVSVSEAGMDDALTYLGYPEATTYRIRTTDMLERVVGEVNRKTKVVEVFSNEVSASTLAAR